MLARLRTHTIYDIQPCAQRLLYFSWSHALILAMTFFISTLLPSFERMSEVSVKVGNASAEVPCAELALLARIFSNTAKHNAGKMFETNGIASFEDYMELPEEIQTKIMCMLDMETIEQCLLSSQHFRSLSDTCVSHCKNYSQITLELQGNSCLVRLETRRGTLYRLFTDGTKGAEKKRRSRHKKTIREVKHPKAMELLLVYLRAMCQNAWIQLIDVDDLSNTERIINSESLVIRLLSSLRDISWVTRVQLGGDLLDFDPSALCALKFERMELKRMNGQSPQSVNAMLAEWVRGERDIYSYGIDFSEGLLTRQGWCTMVNRLFEGLEPRLIRVERDNHREEAAAAANPAVADAAEFAAGRRAVAEMRQEGEEEMAEAPAPERPENSASTSQERPEDEMAVAFPLLHDCDVFTNSYVQYTLRRHRALLFIRLFPHRIMCWVP